MAGHRRGLGRLKEVGQAFTVSSWATQWLVGPLDIQPVEDRYKACRSLDLEGLFGYVPDTL